MISKDLNDIIIENDNYAKLWNEIANFNDLKQLTNQILKGSLAIGDGAIKIIQTSEFEHPILQFIDGCNVRYERKYGRIYEIVFFQYYTLENKTYIFEEHYGYGYIQNILLDEDGKEIPLNTIAELSEIEDFIKLNNNMIYAIPTFLLGMDSEYQNRGKSIFSGKIDSFDGLDESISLMEQAIREGRVKVYIPESCLPRNPETGEIIMTNNSFDNQFIKLDNNLSETGQNRVDVEQPEIHTDSYMVAYQTYLELACLGIVAPCSLGITDEKINANAVAQREREKVTTVMRGQIIESYTKVLVELIIKVLAIKGYIITKDDISINFNAYQSPCFETRLDSMAKAAQYGVMSSRRQIDELYGDDYDETFKSNETIMLLIEKNLLNSTNLKVLKALGEINIDESIYNTLINELEIKETEDTTYGDGNNYRMNEKSTMTRYF